MNAFANTLLYQTRQLRQLEQSATERYDLAALTLMERAGAAALQQLRRRWPAAQEITVMCGKGNNGGDGYVLARLAKQAGLHVTVWQVEPSGEGIAKQQVAPCQEAGVAIEPFAAERFVAGDVIVDALLGIGLRGEVRDVYRQAIDAINRTTVPVLAIDIPSGLNADSGQVMGAAVQAELTVTFIGLKAGLFIGEGLQYCGEVVVDDLGLPPEAYKGLFPIAQLLTDSLVAATLPRRSRYAQKGQFGHVVVIGGDYGMGGAVRMAAEAAARTGVGVVSVATHAEHVEIVSGSRPELMCHAVTSPATLAPLLTKASVIALGPGLGQSDWSKQLFAAAINVAKPKVVDADALNLLATEPLHREDWILTPHPGEAARLLQSTVQAVQTDRFAAAIKLQQRYGGVVILKGAGTLVCAGKNDIAICAAGNPGMASGGMGDVLSGVIAGLLAQGLKLMEAAQVGVYLHARAGDDAVRQSGERGLLALDLMPHLHRLVNPV